ncbi:MAG: hypothetical protein R3D57_16630 [Hyphomicrobiaceae bacterium]
MPILPVRSTALVLFAMACLTPASARATCLPTNPDLSVHGIELGDPLSAALQIGDVELAEDENGQAYAVLTNADETEVLKLYRTFGDTSGAYQEAELLTTDELENDEDATVLETAQFRTGRGVRLSMGRQEVFDLFGTCAPVEQGDDGTEVVRYEVSDIATSDLLKSHNMPLYRAEYVFKQGKLVHLLFGFSYP